MEILYSKAVGTPVFVESGGRPVARIIDILIDPENGKIIAFSVAPNFQKLVSPMDVQMWTSGQMLIRSYDDILDREDLLRAQEVLDRHAMVRKNKVYSLEGDFLGKVYDFAVHPEMMILKKIFVAKSILGLIRINPRIYPYTAIHEILPEKILVKTDSQVLEAIEEESAKAFKLGAA